MNLLTVAPGARKPSHSFPYLTFLIPGEQTNITLSTFFLEAGGLNIGKKEKVFLRGGVGFQRSL